MSALKPPHPGDVYARSKENTAELRARYPKQFEGPFISVSWPDGWHRLVTEVCAYAAARHPELRWEQIKEKFGGLRMYYSGGALRADLHCSDGVYSMVIPREDGEFIASLQEVVSNAEKASLETCCLCGGLSGAPGAKPHNFGGWWLTACPACIPKIEAHRSLPWNER